MKLRQIKGIGPKKAQYLSDMGINSADDLRIFLPNYYENRSILSKLKSASGGQKEYFHLEILTSPKTYFVKKNMSITRLIARDDTDKVNLIWYNDRFSARSLLRGETYKFFGYYNKEKNSMANPIFCKLNEDSIGGIYPIYSIVKGLSKKEFIDFKDRLFELDPLVEDYLPAEVLKKHSLLDLSTMYESLHKPRTFFDLHRAKTSLVIRDLLIDSLASRLNKEDGGKFISFNQIDLKGILKKLSFDLTRDQLSALEDIYRDMTSRKRMNRIIIGDVGSGKTIVAIISAIIAIKSGFQVAFMAPTEILARQHFDNYKNFLARLDISTDLLLGSSSSEKKENIYKKIGSHRLDLLFGTHALFQEKVKFNKLGLVVTDEQQRFGVFQRKLMSDKGKNPDLLLLSATPIPRTLALTMYRDLDFSIIESMPSGRKRIESYLVSPSYEKRFVNFARQNLLKGRQVYVVCPRVYSDKDLDLNSLEDIYKRYKKFFKEEFVVDILHGQMSSEEKIEKQDKFYKGEIDILISTTIIEVGVDVKNANLMIIYDANYFGLSQLHQLRGRIGRGEHQSYCIFVASEGRKDDEKLRFIEKSTNGFEIAQKDLDLRGAGDRYGLFQSGFNDRDIYRYFDSKMLEISNDIVDYIIDKGELSKNALLKKRVEDKLLEYQKVILN
ncbi:MAG: ATP-dependent DNA helicase RecG [Tissierellia bacterium]|nr:ATP-dependent DNA helicase RecG [Tissierellia bacterium]